MRGLYIPYIYTSLSYGQATILYSRQKLLRALFRDNGVWHCFRCIKKSYGLRVECSSFDPSPHLDLDSYPRNIAWGGQQGLCSPRLSYACCAVLCDSPRVRMRHFWHGPRCLVTLGAMPCAPGHPMNSFKLFLCGWENRAKKIFIVVRVLCFL